MEPLRRMTIIAVCILLIGIIALFAIYYSAKKLQGRAQAIPGSVTAEQQDETAVRPEPQAARDVSTEMQQGLPAEPQLSETGKTEKMPVKKADIISEEELMKYLKVKGEVFAAYDKRRSYADLMLNQNAKWSDEQIMYHMHTLTNMRIKKKVGLRDNDLLESRYAYISSALFEWATRTESLPYERKYIGEETFFTSKLSQITPCAQNDALFDSHKEDLGKTFIGDFELVDY